MERFIEKNMQSNRVFVYDERNYLYSDLRGCIFWANKFFREKNIERVMICLPQGFLAYSMIIGAYMSGVTFCCINHNDPVQRKQMYVDEFQPQLVIRQRSQDNFCYCDVLYDDEIQSINNTVDQHLCRNNNSIAYVIYTSGSTGKPKGVKIGRQSFSHAVQCIAAHFGIISDDICSQYPNLNFDMSLIDIFVAVVAGSSLVPFAGFSDRLFPSKKIVKHQITFWNSIPGVIDILDHQGNWNSSVIKSIKKFKFGGDEILPRHMEKVFEVQKEADVFLSYGPTEITLFCCCLSINADNYRQFARHNMSLGSLLPGWHLALSDVEDEIGQIVIYGDMIGLGYIGKQEESGFKTITIDGKEHRAFYTGDYGKYIDGNLYFISRKDMQIKINGNRVDLSEINRILREECCKDVCTIYHNKLIYVFYVSETADIGTIRILLQKRLPAYLVPHHIIPLDALPKNINGKTDRNNLIEVYCS